MSVNNLNTNTNNTSVNKSSNTGNLFFKVVAQDIEIKCRDFYYSKNTRKVFKNTIFISIFIVIAFLLAFLIISASGGNSLDYYLSLLFQPMFQNEQSIWLINTSILGVAGLSFLVAHKSGLFNIGISGQMLGAGLAIVGLSQALQEANSPILEGKAGVILTLLVAMSTGALIALISGLLKNFFKINEVVSAIMLNWIVFYLAKFFIVGSGSDGASDLAGNNSNSATIHENLSLYGIGENGGVAAIILFVILILLVYVIFKFTTYGKKISSIGKSQSAGVYSGYYTKSLQLSAFVFSGAIAGILGVVVYCTDNLFIPASAVGTSNMMPGEGFNGIAISLVAFSHPILVLPISMLFSLPAVKIGSLATGSDSLVLSFAMYAVAIFVIIYRIQPILFIKKQLAKNPKNKKSYFINQYDEDKKNFINEVRKEAANRKINIFVGNQNIDSNIPFSKKFNLRLSKRYDVNNQYFENIKNIKEVLLHSKTQWESQAKNYQIKSNKGDK